MPGGDTGPRRGSCTPSAGIRHRRLLGCRADTPNPRPDVGERGTQVVGANPRHRPCDAQALSALARQLTPQADERGRSLRVRALSVILSSVAVAGAMSATPALAELTGGTSATGTAAPVSAPAKPAPAIRTSPVTARSANIAYTGPVFQRTASGEVIPYTPLTPAGSVNPSGGIAVGVAAETKPQLLVPGSRARYVSGLAAAPMSAPPAVAEVVWAANQIIGLPYIFGGGHGSFESPGYDCSGTVSYALHGARLLSIPADSSEFMHWGSHALGRWV